MTGATVVGEPPKYTSGGLAGEGDFGIARPVPEDALDLTHVRRAVANTDDE
jgi:hypothetical protein